MPILDNAGGLYLDNEVQIANSLLFTEGLITTNRANTDHFLHFQESSSHSGVSSSRYVDGYVGKTGSGSFTFPVGDNGKYKPVTIISASASDFFKVAYFDADPTSLGFDNSDYDNVLLTDISNAGFWDIEGSSSGTVSLNWDASTNLSSFVQGLDTLAVVGWDGSEWVYLGNAGTTGTLSSGSISSQPIVPSSYSAFGLGKASENAFPVSWAGFEVELAGTDALLSWQTASELNSAFFEIERSTDAIVYQTLGRVSAAGTSEEIRSYKFEDKELSFQNASTYYYRIRQEDFNGQYDYSEVKELRIPEAEADIELIIFPNPAHYQVSVRYAFMGSFQMGEIQLNTPTGQVLYHKRIGSQGEVLIPIHHYAEGLYYIVLSNEDATYTKKLWIK